jgi:Carboxypeptidase regulatory-like domain
MNHHRSVIQAVAFLCLLCVGFCAIPTVASAQKQKQVGRLLFGKVLDMHDNPIKDAVVYVTNTRTRAIKTYIVGADGTYRFPALSTAVDYEVYAQYNGHKSDPKSVSQFDDRPQVYLDLKVDTR